LDGNSNQLCAVIFTAIPVEYQAVRNHLIDLHEETHPLGTIYERGTFTAKNKIWSVGIVQTRAGNVNASFETERAIAYFKPQIVIFVGVAGGLKDVRIGDVVVANKVYGYESGKASVTFLPRPAVSIPTYPLLERAIAEARKDDWIKRLASSTLSRTPSVYVAAIAAGEKVLDSTRSTFWKFLKANYSDALAVEMEGYGFLQSTYANRQVDSLIVRGISDLIDGKSEADADNSQELASRHASAFAFEILFKFKEEQKDRSSEHKTGSVEKAKNLVQLKQGPGKYNTQIYGKVHYSAIGDNAQVNINNQDEKTEK
jgi:nucleoside phosphorylase